MGGTNTFDYDQHSYEVPIGTLPSKEATCGQLSRLYQKERKIYNTPVMRFIINAEGETEVVSSKKI